MKAQGNVPSWYWIMAQMRIKFHHVKCVKTFKIHSTGRKPTDSMLLFV